MDRQPLTQELNGKTLHFWTDTEFLVEVSKSKNLKSGYKIAYRFVGSLSQAVLHYDGINIGYGYKKRLRSPQLGLLAQESSQP